MLDNFLNKTVTLVIFDQVKIGKLEFYSYQDNTQFYRVISDDCAFFTLKYSEVDAILIRRNNITIVINENCD